MGEEEQKQKKDKNIVKTLRKVRRTKYAIILTSILLAVIMIFLAAYVVFDTIGKKVSEVMDGIVDFFTFDNKGVITVEDSQVETVIESIQGLGIDIKDIKLMGDVDYTKDDIVEENKKALKKYVKKFLETQAMTQAINPNPNFIKDILYSYGTVYLKRTKENDTDGSKTVDMTMVSLEEMQKLSKDTGPRAANAIRDKFAINKSTGEIVIAGWTTTEVKGGSKTTQIYLRNINYRDAISQFTTPVTFLIYLTMITQNPEFVMAVTELIQDGHIIITIMDNVTTNVETTTHRYVENTETVTPTSGKVQQSSKNDKVESKKESKPKTVTTVTTTTSYNPMVAITDVKTWFSEQKITYKRTDKTTTSKNTTKTEDEKKPDLQGTGSVTWKTNQSTTVSTSTTNYTYEEKNRGDVKVKERLGIKGSPGLNKAGKVDENSTFVGLLDSQFKIPNSQRKERPGHNFKRSVDWFLNLLQNDPTCQRLDLVMRYALYLYTGKDYGVTDESAFQMFNAVLNPISRDIIVDTRQCEKELVIKDVKTLKKAFKGYSGNSELIKNAQAFLDMQEKYHVNALFAAAVSITETSAGRAGNATNGLNNWFNIRGTNTEWAYYSSPKEGILKFGWQIAEGGYYFTAGNFSVATIGKVYCPNTPTHPDQADKWIENTIGFMVDFYEAAGIDVSKYLGGDAAGVVNFALQFVGENHSRFTSYKTSDGKQFWGDEWCAMFVSYCFDNRGAIPGVLKRSFTAVPSEWDYYKAQGRAHTKNSYTPKPGDLAIFSNGGKSGIAHVGIVVKYENGKVYTVEGNTRSNYWTSSVVKTDTYTMDSGWLYGFIEL